MKILHVASFVGNIGDNASHQGLENILREYFNSYNITRLEIRKFYKNYSHIDKKQFDLDFIKFANNFDILIIGGGGFLDYWIEESDTGTTIDLHPDLIPEIKVPTLICSVGCMPHKKVPSGNIDKFRKFLDATLKNPNIQIAVRNDGSLLSLGNDIGSEYLTYIPEVLDNGFFFNTNSESPLPFKNDYIAINITNDQLLMNSKARGFIDKSTYLQSLTKVIKYIIHVLKLKVVFVPHIYSDLKAISEVLDYLSDFTVRNSISVAPYLQHDEGTNTVFSIYKYSRLAISSRYHANVCALAMGVPTIGLVALDRVKYVYDQLNIDNNYVLLDYDFSEDLINKIQRILEEDSIKLSTIIQRIESMKNESKEIYFKILRDFGF